MNYDNWKLQSPYEDDPIVSEPEPQQCEGCGDHYHPDEVLPVRGKRLNGTTYTTNFCVDCINDPDTEEQPDINLISPHAQVYFARMYPDLYPKIS